MTTKSECLTNAQIEGLLDSHGGKADEHRLQSHLDECPECCKRLADLVGDPTWWEEAESILSSSRSQIVLDTLDQIQSKGSELSVSENLLTYLEQWMGPTDDPTKMGRIGGFEVVGIIGVGGAGVVLKAFDPRLNRFVAVKTLLPGLTDNVVARKRFERESQSVAAISHQHVVPIYAVDSYNGAPYIAMQYVAGYSLQQRIDLVGPLKPLEVVRIAAQIASGLAAAHAQGVIHRDIKPSNILLERTVDRVLVSDFGLARAVNDNATHTGSIAGTPQFMSPEQCHGHTIDPRSDLFSLGSVMYTMCTGKPPFRSETIMGMLKSVCESEAPSIREQNPDIPYWLEAFIGRLLKKKPDERWESATEVANLLESELAHLQNPVSFAEPDRSWMPPQTFPATNFPNRNYLVLLFSTTVLGLMALLAWQFELPWGPYSKQAGWDSAKAIPQAGSGAERPFRITKERMLPIPVNQKFVIDVELGDVEIGASENGEAKLKVTRTVFATTELQANLIDQKQSIEVFDESGSTIIRSHPDDKKLVESNGIGDDFEEASVVSDSQISRQSFKLLLPKSASIDVRSELGDIAIEDSTSDVAIRCPVGDVILKNITGAIDIKAGSGTITCDQLIGDVTTESGAGSLKLGYARGTVNAITSSGNIGIEKVDGAVNCTSQTGDIALNFVGQPKSDSKLYTDFGSLHIGLAQELKVHISGKLIGGQIQAPFGEVESDVRSQILDFLLNGGGPNLVFGSRVGNAELFIHQDSN